MGAAMTDLNLESCPFCGEQGDKIQMATQGFNAVVCLNCGARGPMYDDHPEDAVRSWNWLHVSTLRRLYHQMLHMESRVEHSGVFSLPGGEGRNERSLATIESTGDRSLGDEPPKEE